MTSVIVVGAGPVGLVAALSLRKRGLDVLVLEAEPQDRIRPGSRAIYLFQPTLRSLEAVDPGLGRAIAGEGLQVHGVDTWYAGRRVFSAPIPHLDPLRAPGASLPQRHTEELVMKACLDHGVDFRWDVPVQDVRTSPSGVTVVLEGGETLHAEYLVGADGARSVVRRSLGSSLEGPRDDTPFIIVDVDEHPDGSTPQSRGYFHFEHPEVGRRNVMHMPFAGGMRIDLQCEPGDDAAFLASPGGISEWMPLVVDPWYADHVQWVSTYKFHQAVADSFTDEHRRVLLCGEAAHLFAPWGGRGLNSGVMDATDSAVAIARAGRDPERSAEHIQRCADDRRKWGLRNRDLSSRALGQMRASDTTTRVLRDTAARLAPVVVPAGVWLSSIPTKPFAPWPWARSFY